ncbi:MAG: SOS response-associated peptidase family protein [Clostridia bacterium]|nr:SOS response-associated peptidase family protein [Clostridia bacterium]
MCGRFYIEDAFDWADVLRLMGAQNRRLPEAAKRSGEVNPTDAALVLAPSKDLSPGAFVMRWGYRLPDGHLVINARSETARSRPLFADGMRRRRCAVPVSGYIEWDRSGTTRRKYKVDGGTAEPLFLAGLYRPAEKGAEFTVLTRSPSDAVAALHDRMPVLLRAAEATAWIRPDADAQAVLREAVLSVRARLTADSAPEQIGMEL